MSVAVTAVYGKIEFPPNSPHLRIWPEGAPQLPITVCEPLTRTAVPTRFVMSVPVGNVRMIWLPAALDNPPVEEVENVTTYSVFALAAFDGGVRVMIVAAAELLPLTV